MMLPMEGAPSLLRPAPPGSMPGARSLIAILIFGFAALSLAQAQKGAGPKTDKRLALAVNKTLEQGHDAFLPPHISHLLGISPDEQKVPVKQFAEMGEIIKGFEVSATNHNDIVIFVENHSQGESTFYLLSARGTVRKVVSIQAGVGYARAPTASDRTDLAAEKQYWLDRLAPVPPKQNGKN
jgi:hypothetical protein